MRLKRILRENGISWSPVSMNHIQQSNPLKRKTRSSMPTQAPYLPMEIILRILKFAMKSPNSIVDPLSPLTPENLSDKEKTQGNQIAINFLATCKALHDTCGNRIRSHLQPLGPSVSLQTFLPSFVGVSLM